MNPDSMIDSRLEYSITCLSNAIAAMKAGDRESALFWIGTGLHPVQDISAHANYSPKEKPIRHPESYDDRWLDFDPNGSTQICSGAALEFVKGNKRYKQFIIDTKQYLERAYDILYGGNPSLCDPLWWL